MQYVYKRITNPFYQNDFIFFNLPVGRNMLKFVRLFNEVTGKLVAEKKLAMQNADKMNDHYIDDSNLNRNLSNDREIFISIGFL